MPVSKLKNLAILILALVNVLLLALVLPLRHERQEQRELAARELEALYARYGVSLDADALPDDEILYTLEFSPGDDAALPAMQALLGENVLVEDDSTRYLRLYRSDRGTCQLSRGGALEARLTDGEAGDDLARDAATLLESMGLELDSVSAPERLSAGVYAVTAVQRLLGAPVFSSTLTCTTRSGVLTGIEGTAYFDTADLVRTDDVTCISCADALAAFLGSRDELGWVGGAVLDMTQGYLRAETASAAVVRLVPGWRLTTDTASFWINGITREVTVLEGA